MTTSIRVYVVLFSCISLHTGLHYSRFSLFYVKLIYFRNVLVTLCCYVVFTRFVVFLLCCHCGLVFFSRILYFILRRLYTATAASVLIVVWCYGVGVRCRLLPDINATAARYCWHEKPLRSLSLRWKEHFPYLTKFCWTPGNSHEVTGTDYVIENAHFLSAL